MLTSGRRISRTEAIVRERAFLKRGRSRCLSGLVLNGGELGVLVRHVIVQRPRARLGR